jgi:hypothetical protein
VQQCVFFALGASGEAMRRFGAPFVHGLAPEPADRNAVFHRDGLGIDFPVQTAARFIQTDSSLSAKSGIPNDAPSSVWDEGMTLNFFRLREITHAVLPVM